MCTSNNQNLHVEAQAQLGDHKKLAYEKAIEGYQFQVGRYNTWMNYYAIFVGALFVAFYTIWSNGNKCCCGGCPTAVADDGGKWILLLIIAILGFVASACWYGALLGYHKWNSHWVGVVQKIEKLVFTDSEQPDDNMNQNENMDNNSADNKDNKPLKVYNDMPEVDKSEYAKGYISTQKITGIFIIGIMIAWIAAFAFAIYKYNNDCCWAGILAFGIGIAIMIVLLLCLHQLRCGAYCSTIVKK